MKNIWQSKLSRELKIKLFQATVVSILLYGSETWTISNTLAKRIDGCFTRMLRMALNISWKAHLTNEVVYGRLPRITQTIRARRMKLAGHMSRHRDIVGHNLTLWEPTHGHRTCGRPHQTYFNTIQVDTGLDSSEEIRKLMADRVLWR